MLKKVLIFLFIVALIFLAVVLIGMRKFEKLLEKHVSLKANTELNISIVNVQDLSREEIAKTIMSINNCNPKVILLDLFLAKYNNELTPDTLLLHALKTSNVIVSVRSNNRYATNIKFQKHASRIGIAEVALEYNYVSAYSLYHIFGNDTVNHVAYEAALEMDSIKAIDFFLSKTELQTSDASRTFIVSRLPYQIPGISSTEPIHCDSIQNRIIILGLRGPSDEDKFVTYARFFRQFGMKIIVNQDMICMAQKSSRILFAKF